MIAKTSNKEEEDMKCISREIAEYIYEVKLGDETIVYAPILHTAKLTTSGIRGVDSDIPVEELSANSREFVENGGAHILRPVRSPCDIDNMVILPNYKCNFSCSYCYAAKGRSNEEIDIKTLDAAMDWFLDKNRIPEKDLYIFIVGGGEPVMSWGIIEEIVKKVSEARNFRKRKVALAMTTNGSLINEERARFLAGTDIMVNVSFEVIRDVQNRQRGMCDEVEHGIEALQRAGARFAIRATVSPLNVDRMPEMVDIVLRRFPHVKRLNLEAMLAGKGVFSSADSLRNFLERFRVGFAEACMRGKNNGLKVISAAARQDLTMLKDRFCKGDLCLTPRGDVSICRRFSSPNEDNFLHTVFGHVEDGCLRVDEEAYHRALEFSLDKRNQCKQCFLRWHCGGLCLSQQTMFPPDYYDVICDFAREEGFECLKRLASNGGLQEGVPALSQQQSEMARSDKRNKEEQ